jgi:hypothetical protein
MANPLGTDEPVATADDEHDESTEEVRDQVSTMLDDYFRENAASASTLQALGAEKAADKVVRKHRRRPKKSVGGSQHKQIDWSTPPNVDPDDVGDFRQMLSKKYKGSNEQQARQRFAEHGQDYDTCTAADFTAMIRAVRNDVSVSDTLGPALHYFCQYQIPGQHREDWAIAIMAASDRHEGED